jgi:cytochrome c peroxidase
LAQTGKATFDQTCAVCHAPNGARVNTIIDIKEISTDRERLDTWTQAAADAANAKVKSMGITRKNMIKTSGYSAPPLDGLWLRAPYLHNGSVPSLKDMLEPEARRTKVFYRGYDVYDPVNVGFIVQGSEPERVGFRFDVAERGNGNRGHRYGTDLPPEKKRALLEYLKTL